MNYKQLLMLSVFAVSTKAIGQTVDNKVLNSAGGSSMVSNLFLESNVGEPFTGEGESAGYLKLTHGFLQPIASNNGTTNTAPNPPSFPASMAPYGIDNAGNSVLAGNILLENTVGEWMTTARTGGSHMLTQGILQPGGVVANIPLPVTQLEFWAKRINNQQVQLDWKTLQEANNKGFGVERMKQNEGAYSGIHFEPSKAAGGNSTLPLTYQYIDQNSFLGRTYYRLRQEDLDGKITYSTVQVVQSSKGKGVKLTAYPNPAVSEFSVLLETIIINAKEETTQSTTDLLYLYDMQGRVVQQHAIISGVPLKITNLTPGVYLVKLKNEPEISHKVVVQ